MSIPPFYCMNMNDVPTMPGCFLYYATDTTRVDMCTNPGSAMYGSLPYAEFKKRILEFFAMVEENDIHADAHA